MHSAAPPLRAVLRTCTTQSDPIFTMLAVAVTWCICTAVCHEAHGRQCTSFAALAHHVTVVGLNPTLRIRRPTAHCTLLQ